MIPWTNANRHNSNGKMLMHAAAADTYGDGCPDAGVPPLISTDSNDLVVTRALP
jgi:hypothetical protein